MQLEALFIDDAHIGKSPLLNLAPKSKFLVGPERKAALNQLHCLLKTHVARNGHQDVNVIGHDDKIVNNRPSTPHG
jgi:hypothetical protein